jgi:hypothetical protein
MAVVYSADAELPIQDGGGILPLPILFMASCLTEPMEHFNFILPLAQCVGLEISGRFLTQF